MIYKTNPDSWECFDDLPAEIQEQARQKYRLWRDDPHQTVLCFKPQLEGVGSVRINQSYRAVGRKKGNLIVWFWIGTHADYDQFIKRLAG